MEINRKKRVFLLAERHYSGGFGVYRVIGIISVMIVRRAVLALIPANNAVVVNHRNDDQGGGFYRRSQIFLDESHKNVSARRLAGVVAGGEEYFSLTVAEADHRDLARSARDAKNLGFNAGLRQKGVEIFRIINHIVREIHERFVVGEGISE